MSGAAPRPAQQQQKSSSSSSNGNGNGNGNGNSSNSNGNNQIHIEQAAKDARMQEHWLKWSGIANTDRTYPVVFDKSPAPVTTELKRLVGPNIKTAAVHRVPGLDEDAEPGKDLGNVMVGLVSAATYATLSETFGFKSITVKLGAGERTAFVPVGRASPAQQAKGKAED
ncbi:uncharacterized protein B0H64DRAFT_449095 [Chaetomium fimeti]|uniref:Uncharacterized protein n=1 Tax=Chaetomium fimeti TaxID=1854472 RepID=A0AAE0HQ88_9PEZI|nr:hypothetical protein B0H64DRAFT_449095 [Chaetomium fimeti]